jgi:2-polyprenyl-6-methoxyphenol hydroxylase-like FAD-dependent oxidoreductase
MQGALLSGCERHPAIQFFLGTTVLQVDYTPTSEGKTRFLIKRGKNAKQGLDTVNEVEDKEQVWLEADVIVAADGIRSTARKCMLALEEEEDKGICDFPPAEHNL